MRELPAGDDAVLLDFSGMPDPAGAAALAARALRAALDSGELPLADVVPSAHAVLVQAPPGAGINALAVQRVVRAAGRPNAAGVPGAAEVAIPVHYDGDDLAEVAELTDTTPESLVIAHTSLRWRVQFMGFAPGFGYLVPDDDPANDPAQVRLFADLSRRTQSRPTVPTGSVAVAAGYSAVYPHSSPGGWFLLGRTELTMWDPTASPPAALTAGTVVRFTCVD